MVFCSMKRWKSRFFIALFMMSIILSFESTAFAQTESVPLELTSPSAVLMEASTGEIIFEKNPDEVRSPASITKIMTLLLIFDAIKDGKIHLEDEVCTSAYAKSMGGSQVFLEEGEIQTVDTLMKCIAVASGNDASVAMAEHVGGTEEAFVAKMNEKASELGMNHTHFVDCCGLSSSKDHYTTARDVAIMSRALITTYPEIYNYSRIWMEDITHVTKQGTKPFTLSSTNKLLKQYKWTTGLKTGSTSVAKYCLSATANKNGIDLIAVVMGAPDFKIRFSEAKKMLEYGYSLVKMFQDEEALQIAELPVLQGKSETVSVDREKAFSYLDTKGMDFTKISKKEIFEEKIVAPIEQNQKVGTIQYFYENQCIGEVPIIAKEAVEKATYIDYLKKIWMTFLFTI